MLPIQRLLPCIIRESECGRASEWEWRRGRKRLMWSGDHEPTTGPLLYSYIFGRNGNYRIHIIVSPIRLSIFAFFHNFPLPLQSFGFMSPRPRSALPFSFKCDAVKSTHCFVRVCNVHCVYDRLLAEFHMKIASDRKCRHFYVNETSAGVASVQSFSGKCMGLEIDVAVPMAIKFFDANIQVKYTREFQNEFWRLKCTRVNTRNRFNVRRKCKRMVLLFVSGVEGTL